MSYKSLMNKTQAERVNEAYEKVVAYQDKLNASITMIKPELTEEKTGKLAGMPIALKDNVSTKGILTTAASNILDNYVPIYDATITKKLEAAGAVCVSKASMDELAMGGTNLTANIGPCHNPYDLNRISGGSSGGSAVLVASGAVPMAIGSDTGDSVRKPASFCGIVGVKPSYGRISRYGIIPYASSLDHVAYFTTNVEDAALTLEVLAGRDDKDMTSSFEEVPNYSELLDGEVKGKKILVFKNVVDSISNQAVVEGFNKVVADLKEKGAEIKEVTFDHDLMRALFPTYFVIANAEATANHSNLDGIRFGHRVDAPTMEEIMVETRTRGFSTFIKKRFITGSYSLFEENQEKILKKAQRVRRLIVEAVMAELKNADAIIAPAAPGVAPLIDAEPVDTLSDEYLIADNHMVIGNFAGLPSMTLPMTMIDGLPVGISVSANPFKEVTMFNVAKAIEDGTGLKDMIKEDF